MNFADILDKWEHISGSCAGKDTDKDSENETGFTPDEKRKYLRRKNPDDILDIHGQTSDGAWVSLEHFFSEAKDKGYKKLRIIHGKGNNSQGEAVLQHTVRKFLEKHPNAGESGFEKAANGGTGATWVFLK